MKFIKRFLLIIFTSLLCLVAVGFILAFFYEDEIGAKVVKELSKQLQVDLKVKKVELSVFSGFPDASVNLDDVLLFIVDVLNEHATFLSSSPTASAAVENAWGIPVGAQGTCILPGVLSRKK